MEFTLVVCALTSFPDIHALSCRGVSTVYILRGLVFEGLVVARGWLGGGKYYLAGGLFVNPFNS